MTTVWIHEGVVAEAVEESGRRYPHETGGVLVGYWAERQAVVTNVVGPGPLASHRETRFEPDYDHHDEQVARLYTASGGALTYLGDWHSHGAGSPYLSMKDRSTLYGIATDPGSRAPRALMMVLGESPDWRLRVWQYTWTPLPRLTYAWSARECTFRTYD
jgi:integrative and conjugative element protein (TIGR02256 family)